MGDQFLSEKRFDKFIENDFAHLESALSATKGRVNYILGTLVVLVPLVLAILGIVVTLAFAN